MTQSSAFARGQFGKLEAVGLKVFRFTFQPQYSNFLISIENFTDFSLLTKKLQSPKKAASCDHNPDAQMEKSIPNLKNEYKFCSSKKFNFLYKRKRNKGYIL